MASEGNQPEIIVKEEPDAETENGVDPNNKVNVKFIFLNINVDVTIVG